MARKPAVEGRKKKDETSARAHSDYADNGNTPDAAPRETGDYCDPVKHVTGRGNASKGPYKKQGGAGHGDNYGAREERAKSNDKPED